MTLLTIFVCGFDSDNIIEVTIDSEQTFWEFRKKTANMLKMNPNNLILAEKIEYDKSYNSKKMSEVTGIYDFMTLFAIFQN